MIRFDKPFLDTFVRLEVRGEDIDLGGRFTRKLAALNNVLSYRLRGPAGVPIAREEVLSVQALRQAGSLRPCYNADHYGTDIAIVGDGQPQLYCLMLPARPGLEPNVRFQRNPARKRTGRRPPQAVFQEQSDPHRNEAFERQGAG